MKNINVKKKIIAELEEAITTSCAAPEKEKKHNELHIALLKKYYNATDVYIDYMRKRVYMNIVMDETAFTTGKLSTNMPLLPANIMFGNLRLFLKSCIQNNQKNLGFYAQLLRSFTKEERHYAIV